MKLSNIHEAETAVGGPGRSGWFGQPLGVIEPAGPASGADGGSRVTGSVLMPVGVPAKPRHREFFGDAESAADLPELSG